MRRVVATILVVGCFYISGNLQGMMLGKDNPILQAIDEDNEETFNAKLTSLLDEKKNEMKDIIVGPPGPTFIFYAAAKGGEKIINNLIDKWGFTTEDGSETESGETPIFKAVEYMNKPALEALLKKGADINVQIDSDGNYILHHLITAIVSNYHEKKKTILKEATAIFDVLLGNDVEPDLKNDLGKTFVQYAKIIQKKKQKKEKELAKILGQFIGYAKKKPKQERKKKKKSPISPLDLKEFLKIQS